MFELAKGRDAQQQCLSFFLETVSTEECIDFVDLSFRRVYQRVIYYSTQSAAYAPERKQYEDVIAELNYRLREHAVGYQFEKGEIIRVDSQYIHAEAVKPALALLHNASFAGASEQFLQAHEHYRAK